MRSQQGFTLLEVLVALAILGLAVVTMIQLFGQGLRLLKVSGDYQQAVLLADQKLREVETVREGTETGPPEGLFEWERRSTVMPVPEELTVSGIAPLRLYRVTVEVRWGTRSVEVATLRTAREPLPQ